LQPQVSEFFLVKLKHKPLWKSCKIPVDLLIQPFGRLAVARRQIGVKYHPLATNEVNAMCNVANGKRRI